MFAAASVMLKSAATYQPGPHGLSEVLVQLRLCRPTTTARRSPIRAPARSGTPSTQGIAMLIGRFFLIIPALAIGGSLAAKPKVPATSGTLPTHTPLFGVLVAGVIAIVAGLTFFPALALGPILEHLSL